MSLKVIGSGFGRTGTMSTKLALEQLGFGPCHHMFEVTGSEAQQGYWKAIANGDKVVWADVFAGFGAQVDWPGAAVWHQTSIAFPQAKVIHTERPADDWWASFAVTIGKFFALYKTIPLPPHIAELVVEMDKLILGGTFGGRIERASAIAAYRRNNEKVRDIIAKDRLLVYTPAQGWDPLCKFLNVPVPATAFPRSNARDEFWAVFGGEPVEAAKEVGAL